MKLKISLVSDKNKNSNKIKYKLEKKIKCSSIKNSEIIIVIGGDGFMLQTLKKFYKFKKPFYGINLALWFLMNKFYEKNIIKNLVKTDKIKINTTDECKNKSNKIKKSIAINEISILHKVDNAIIN